MATPKLRFKEFDESWSQVILDDLAEVERGKFSVRPRNDPRYFGGKMPFVQTGDVTGSDVYLKGFSQTLNEHGIKVSKVFPENTILITIAANIGDTTITQYPVACPDSVVAIQPKKELTNTIFLKNIIDLQKDFLDSQATQNAQKNINLQVLKPLELIVPKLEEQTKIASFLSAVDEKIAQLTKKHELLSQYKQGMMQKIFNQQIRFKADDGSEFGEWEEKELKDVANLTSSKRVHLADYVSKGIPFFRGKEITELKSGGFPSDILYISPIQFNEFKEKFGAPKNGEILITAVGTLANTYLINTNYEFYFKDGNLIWLKDIKSNPNFLMILLDAHKNDVLASAIGSTQKALTIANLNKLIFKFPTLEEQTKISNFLFAIDQKIEVIAKQIEQAKQWKKGLLQQMFV